MFPLTLYHCGEVKELQTSGAQRNEYIDTPTWFLMHNFPLFYIFTFITFAYMHMVSEGCPQ